MNQTLFENWITNQLNQNEDTQKTKIKKEKKKYKSKEYQQNQKDMNELETLFSQLTLSDKNQKQQQMVKIDFEQFSDISKVYDEEFLKWILSQFRLLFSQRKVNSISSKLDFLFNLLFDEEEIKFLEQGICSRLGLDNDSFNLQEQKIFLKNIFKNIFEV
ncbi:unnamed protein product [Paramecium sonneborni]|uniref:Uncharacterized protein n=1 Tax=Paramecium sonneborni TaxID=65129 RepID=A0A8S1RR88_9CILI|nr:unnamed protein product [Paramecium sonneborni]